MARGSSRDERDPAPGDSSGAGPFAPPAHRSAAPTTGPQEPSAGPVPLAELVAALAATGAPTPPAVHSPAPPTGNASIRRIGSGRLRPKGEGGRSASCPSVPTAAAVPHRDGADEPPSDDEERAMDLSEDGSGLFAGGDARSRARRPRRPPPTATQRAIGLLSRREHSRKELTRKLVQKGLDPEEVATAVGRVADAGWQDERRFAESLVRSRASSGYGPLHIRAELATHDLPAELRAEVLDAFEGDWTEIARDTVRRRFGRVEDARLRERKAADYLVRRGFTADVVRAVARFEPED